MPRNDIDWQRFDMERSIEKARDDAYYAEKRLKDRMAAMREEQQEYTSDIESRISELEAAVRDIKAELQKAKGNL